MNDKDYLWRMAHADPELRPAIQRAADTVQRESARDCSPERHGRLGVIHCPHGCVTECRHLAVSPLDEEALAAGRIEPEREDPRGSRSGSDD